MRLTTRATAVITWPNNDVIADDGVVVAGTASFPLQKSLSQTQT